MITVTYPNEPASKEYTYQPVLSREKKIPLIAVGSPAFQQIIKECQQNGLACQIMINPKESYEELIKKYFKDSPFTCQGCRKLKTYEKEIQICLKPAQCYHQINNAKIISVETTKKDPVKYFQFFFSATFQNKLRPKNEEIIVILMDEKGLIVNDEDISESNFLDTDIVEIQDFKAKLKPEVFDNLEKLAENKLNSIIKEKATLFDLTLNKERNSKINSFEKRLRRERREQVISRKHDFDFSKWQANYEMLLKREEESFITRIAIKFVNLLIINTTKTTFEINLDNNSTINGSFITGIDHSSTVTCPICRKTFSEGYATADSFYVCKNCVRQSIDTGKIYSTKAPLALDDTLKEYFERDGGFVCSVCGKRYSRMLEFKCSHDNSSVCIHHYGHCDICGKNFSKLNLSHTQEFKRQLCPKHAVKCGACQVTMGVDEGMLCKANGKRYCVNCVKFTKCSVCQQDYAAYSLVNGKCPACSNLKEPTDQTLTRIIQSFDDSQRSTTKWLEGKNALNAVVIGKNKFSNVLYVVENDKVVFKKPISFLDKLEERR